MRKGWEYKKLGEVLETTSGGTPSKSHKEYYEGGTIPWLRSGEVSKGDIYDAELYITEEGLKKSSAKLFPIDTVLIAMYGATVGQVGILKSTMCTNQAICGILPNKDFHPNFLKYVLLANKKNYLKQAIGGAQPNISQQVIKSTYIPIVKFSEQESVVSELDKINELIRLKKEQLKDFDNLAQSIFYEMFGDPVENEMGWEVKKLGDNVEEMFLGPFGSALKVDSYVPKEDSYCMVYEQKHAIKKSLNLENHYINKEKFDSLKRFCVMPGDFIMSCRGTIGKLYQIPPGAPMGIIHPSLMKIRLKQNGYDSTYFNFMLVKIVAIESTNGNCVQMAITAKALSKKELPLPPLPLQHLFAQRIEQIEHQKSEVQKAITDLETLLASRMQYWFE